MFLKNDAPVNSGSLRRVRCFGEPSLHTAFVGAPPQWGFARTGAPERNLTIVERCERKCGGTFRTGRTVGAYSATDSWQATGRQAHTLLTHPIHNRAARDLGRCHSASGYMRMWLPVQNGSDT